MGFGDFFLGIASSNVVKCSINTYLSVSIVFFVFLLTIIQMMQPLTCLTCGLEIGKALPWVAKIVLGSRGGGYQCAICRAVHAVLREKQERQLGDEELGSSRRSHATNSCLTCGLGLGLRPQDDLGEPGGGYLCASCRLVLVARREQIELEQTHARQALLQLGDKELGVRLRYFLTTFLKCIPAKDLGSFLRTAMIGDSSKTAEMTQKVLIAIRQIEQLARWSPGKFS